MIRLPAETERQRAVWLSWPGNPATWPGQRQAVQEAHAHLAALCTRFQPVDLMCPSPWQPDCLQYLKQAAADVSRVTLHDWPVNDAWARDMGPVFVETDAGLQVVDLPFRGWGGKVADWRDDDAVPRRVSECRNLVCRRFPYVGEGGAWESNGRGVLLVTESVWLNPNRNPGAGKADLEEAFRRELGIESVIWLPAGMACDDTDGHVDTLARFAGPDTVLVPSPDSRHPDAARFRENRCILEASFTVIDLPAAVPGGRPASYANFLLLNEAVLMPTFGLPADDQAMEVLTHVFPGRAVLPVPSQVFLAEGGAVHCLAATEPAT